MAFGVLEKKATVQTNGRDIQAVAPSGGDDWPDEDTATLHRPDGADPGRGLQVDR